MVKRNDDYDIQETVREGTPLIPIIERGLPDEKQRPDGIEEDWESQR